MRTTGRPLPRQKHDVNHKQQCTMYNVQFKFHCALTWFKHWTAKPPAGRGTATGLYKAAVHHRSAATSCAFDSSGPWPPSVSVVTSLYTASKYAPVTDTSIYMRTKKLNSELQLTSFTYLLNSTIGPHAHERPQLTRNEIKWWLTSISLQLLHVLQQIKCK